MSRINDIWQRKPAGMVLGLDFSGGRVTSPTGHSGTLNNGASISGRTLLLDGVDDYLVFADAPEFSFTSAGQDLPFSLSAWVYLTASAASPKTVISKIESVSPARVEWAFYNSSNAAQYNGPALTLFHSDASKSLTGAVVANVVPATTWTCLTATYDGSEAATGIKVFVNAVDLTGYRDTTAGYTGMSNTSAALNIGRRELSGLHLGGSMADVRIYNRVLTAPEIAQIYNAGAARIAQGGTP